MDKMRPGWGLRETVFVRGQSRISSDHTAGTEKLKMMCDHEKSNIKI